jgi:hypothetical protein
MVWGGTGRRDSWSRDVCTLGTCKGIAVTRTQAVGGQSWDHPSCTLDRRTEAWQWLWEVGNCPPAEHTAGKDRLFLRKANLALLLCLNNSLIETQSSTEHSKANKIFWPMHFSKIMLLAACFKHSKTSVMLRVVSHSSRPGMQWLASSVPARMT